MEHLEETQIGTRELNVILNRVKVDIVTTELLQKLILTFSSATGIPTLYSEMENRINSQIIDDM